MRMIVRIAPVGFLLVACLAAHGQDVKTEGKPQSESRNAQNGTSVMQAIGAVGVRSHQPIGLVLGRDYGRLCRLAVDFDSEGLAAPEALQKIAEFSGYTLQQDGAAVVLIAPDVEVWQPEILRHQFSHFGVSGHAQMTVLAANLTGWMWTEVGHAPGYGLDPPLTTRSSPSLSPNQRRPSRSPTASCNSAIMESGY